MLCGSESPADERPSTTSALLPTPDSPFTTNTSTSDTFSISSATAFLRSMYTQRLPLISAISALTESHAIRLILLRVCQQCSCRRIVGSSSACVSRRKIVRSTRAALGAYSLARTTSRSRSSDAAVRSESRTTPVRLFATPDQSVSSGGSNRRIDTVSLESHCHVRLWTTDALASSTSRSSSAICTSFSS